MKNNAWAVWGPSGPLDKTAMIGGYVSAKLRSVDALDPDNMQSERVGVSGFGTPVALFSG